jgi:hypothetical protein
MADDGPHIEYRIDAERVYDTDPAKGDCVDTLSAKIHGKEQADALVAFLKGQGYKTKLIRITIKYLIDDRFPGESALPGDPMDDTQKF